MTKIFCDNEPQSLKASIDLISVPVFVVDLEQDGEFRVIALNAAHTRITGLTNAFARGRTPAELLSKPAEAKAVMKHYKDCLSSNLPNSYREVLTIDGTAMTFDTTLHPLACGNGRPDRIVGTALRVLVQGRKKSDNAYFLSQLRGSLTTMEHLLQQSDDQLSRHETNALQILLSGALSSLQQVQSINRDLQISEYEGAADLHADSSRQSRLN